MTSFLVGVVIGVFVAICVFFLALPSRSLRRRAVINDYRLIPDSSHRRRLSRAM